MLPIGYMAIGGMPGWLKDFVFGTFGIKDLFILPGLMWKLTMEFATGSIAQSPDKYSKAAWDLVTQTFYPWFLSAGLALINIFCLIGFIKQSTNLRENVTMEMWIELFIKVIISNVLMVSGLSLVQDFFKCSTEICKFINTNTTPDIITNDIDVGFVITYLIIGLIFSVAAVVACSKIIIEILQRYLNIYLLVIFMPIALSTWSGGRGIEDTAFSWIRSFLTCVFQIVVISLVIQIGCVIASNTGASFKDMGVLGLFTGGPSLIFSMIMMFFVSSAIKGSDALMKRVFNLR